MPSFKTKSPSCRSRGSNVKPLGVQKKQVVFTYDQLVAMVAQYQQYTTILQTNCVILQHNNLQLTTVLQHKQAEESKSDRIQLCKIFEALRKCVEFDVPVHGL